MEKLLNAIGGAIIIGVCCVLMLGIGVLDMLQIDVLLGGEITGVVYLGVLLMCFVSFWLAKKIGIDGDIDDIGDFGD